ncbi:response regulator transcription factor [bacterium]|nr:response regulator transcription factor [bacterium]
MTFNRVFSSDEKAAKRRDVPSWAWWFCMPMAMLGLLGSYPLASCDPEAIAAYPTWENWLARCVSLIVYLWGAIECGQGRRIAGKPGLALASGLVLTCGVILTLALPGSEHTFVFSQALVGLSNPLVILAWADALATLRTIPRRMVILMGATLSTVIGFVFDILPTAASAALYVAVVIGSAVPLLFVSNGGRLDDVRDAGNDPSRTTGMLDAGRLIPFELILLMACYSFMFRALQAFGSDVSRTDPVLSLAQHLMTLCALCVIAVWLGAARPASASDGDGARDENDRPITMLLFLAAGALASLPIVDDSLKPFASAFARACWPLFYYLLFIILIELGGNRGAATFSFGWLVLNVLLVALAPLAYAMVSQVSAGALSLTALAVILIYTLLVATLLVRRSAFRHDHQAHAQIHDSSQMVDPPAVASAEAFDTRCDTIAHAHGLTPRETEVFKLLAKGRSIPFICDELSISRSTVKGHTQNIYTKCGVHGKQDLISMFEEDDESEKPGLQHDGENEKTPSAS